MPADETADRPVTRADLDRAIGFIVAEFTRLQGEIKSGDDNNGRRLDRMSETLRSMDSRLSAMPKWSDTLDRDNAALNANFHELQRAVAALDARVKRIEAH